MKSLTEILTDSSLGSCFWFVGYLCQRGRIPIPMDHEFPSFEVQRILETVTQVTALWVETDLQTYIFCPVQANKGVAEHEMDQLSHNKCYFNCQGGVTSHHKNYLLIKI